MRSWHDAESWAELRAEEVDDFTDWLSVVNRAGETISLEQLETYLEND